jgi:hypothetical protein
MLVVLNFRDRAASLDAGVDWSKVKVMLGNYPAASQQGRLQPYEAVVYELVQ